MRKSERHSKDRGLSNLGDALRNRRVELELTQEEVGFSAGLHRTYITDIENGLRNISFLTLAKVSEALQCRISVIMLNAESMAPETP